MEQAVKQRVRYKRPPLSLALLVAGAALSLFGIVAASGEPQAAAPPPSEFMEPVMTYRLNLPEPQAAALPISEFTTSTDAPLITPAPSAADTPAPYVYVPDEAEVEMLARVLWGEARGVPSDMEKAAVAWCVLNRVDAACWPDSVAEVVTQPFQFAGYSPDYPATEELKAIAADVLTRWEREKAGESDTGRVLPAEYVFFTGDGGRNYFRKEFDSEAYWDWSLQNPYDS